MQHKVIVKGWVRKGKKFLLAKRGASEAHHAGVWSLPGGNVEDVVEDSVLESTLKREIGEEIGIEVGDEMRLIYNNSFIKESDRSHVINLTFLCDWKFGEAKPKEDTAEVAWFSLKELQNFKSPPDFLKKETEKLVRHLDLQQENGQGR